MQLHTLNKSGLLLTFFEQKPRAAISLILVSLISAIYCQFGHLTVIYEKLIPCPVDYSGGGYGIFFLRFNPRSWMPYNQPELFPPGCLISSYSTTCHDSLDPSTENGTTG
jgi:hypothetical protein